MLTWPRPPRAAHHVGEVERRLAEEPGAALVLEHQQAPLDGADRGRGDIAVLPRELARALRDMGQHGPQVGEVEQRQPLVGGDPEDDVEHALLRFVELEQAREQQGAHLGDGGADGVPLLAEDVPEDDGTSLVAIVGKADRLGARDQLFVSGMGGRAGLGQPREVALDVSEEDRDAGLGKAFGEDLQRHRLARAGGAGDEPVPVGAAQQKALRLRLIGAAAADENPRSFRHRSSPAGRRANRTICVVLIHLVNH